MPNRRSVIVNETRTYTVILEPAEEGGFVVHVQALPEVVTEGDTEEEALAMAKDAIELVLESRREPGEPIPVEVGKAKVREVTVAITHERRRWRARRRPSPLPSPRRAKSATGRGDHVAVVVRFCHGRAVGRPPS